MSRAVKSGTIRDVSSRNLHRPSRTGLLFALGVFLPSLVLAWLAIRTLGEQQVILERQAAALSQSESDAVAERVRLLLAELEAEFSEAIHQKLQTEAPWDLARDLPRELESIPPGAALFALSPGGELLSDLDKGQRDAETARAFAANAPFLSNRVEAEVYQSGASLARDELQPRQRAQPIAEFRKADPPPPSEGLPSAGAAAAVRESPGALAVSEDGEGRKLQDPSETDAADRTGEFEVKLPSVAPSPPQPRTVRRVIPQKLAQEITREAPPAASVEPELSDFQTAVAGLNQGMLARFVEDHLELIVWTRAASAPGYLFGYMIPASDLGEQLSEALGPAASRGGEDVLALLDERAQPVAVSDPAFRADWQRPFVATEIGERLPFWEAALYLRNPDRILASARGMRLVLGLFVALALAAIAVAGWLVVRDTRRQLELAEKKADFVSNVSHELKTPLTSIRMFAELLGREALSGDKRSRYLDIIQREAERLTRLINQVLDFSRIEQGRKVYRMEAVDYLPVLRRFWETQSTHLAEAGFDADWRAEGNAYPLHADAESLTRALLNLVSNAEKYGRGSVRLESRLRGDQLEIGVIDNGPGIPPSEARRIFEPFYRTDDRLASQTQGSGLGLTLARQIVEDHGGSLTYDPTPEGESRFRILLPLAAPSQRPCPSAS